jgi:hypothetical protein
MMMIVSLDSPSCEVPCWILLSVVYRDVTRQAKGVTPFEARWSPRKRGLAYLSQCNSGWFCHTEGVLWFNERIVVPKDHKLRKQVLDEAHLSKFYMHPGSTKMYQDLKQSFWWTRMK